MRRRVKKVDVIKPDRFLGSKYHMGDTNFSTDRAHELSYMQKGCQLK